MLVDRRRFLGMFGAGLALEGTRLAGLSAAPPEPALDQERWFYVFDRHVPEVQGGFDRCRLPFVTVFETASPFGSADPRGDSAIFETGLWEGGEFARTRFSGDIAAQGWLALDDCPQWRWFPFDQRAGEVFDRLVRVRTGQDRPGLGRLPALLTCRPDCPISYEDAIATATLMGTSAYDVCAIVYEGHLDTQLLPFRRKRLAALRERVSGMLVANTRDVQRMPSYRDGPDVLTNFLLDMTVGSGIHGLEWSSVRAVLGSGGRIAYLDWPLACPRGLLGVAAEDFARRLPSFIPGISEARAVLLLVDYDDLDCPEETAWAVLDTLCSNFENIARGQIVVGNVKRAEDLPGPYPLVRIMTVGMPRQPVDAV